MSDTEKHALIAANRNPWYCLATLHGEQPVDGFDPEIAEKNRDAWNRFSGDTTEGMREELARIFKGRTEGSVTSPQLAANPDFSLTHFDRAVNFDGFQFARKTVFSSAKFSKAAVFKSAVFSGPVDFGSATFAGTADFNAATFLGTAYFESATFSRRANFRSTKFDQWTNFDLATFSDHVVFRSMFYGSAHFRSATFANRANFSSRGFHHAANLSSASFANEIKFVNVTFHSETSFADVRFKGSVPDFRGAKMHEATEWHGATWPGPPDSKDAAQDQVYTYERLKQEMERLKKHEDEHMFFRKELRARRGLAKLLSSEWLLNSFYETLSDYGASIIRPSLGMVVCFAFGFFIFQGTQVFNGTHLTRAAAAALSFGNIFSFLPIRREIMTDDMIKGLSYGAQIIGVLQSLFGAILLFLLGLALRNRFRMK